MTMTDDRQLTCAERIESQLQGRADDVRKMLAAQGGDKVCQHCGQAIWRNGSDTEWVADGVCSTPAHEVDEDYHEDSLYDFGLSLARKVVLRFDMSTGGPADWLEVLCDEESQDFGSGEGSCTRLDVERVTYHFADWFDHAEMTVEQDSPLYALAEWIAETQSA